MFFHGWLMWSVFLFFQICSPFFWFLVSSFFLIDLRHHYQHWHCQNCFEIKLDWKMLETHRFHPPNPKSKVNGNKSWKSQTDNFVFETCCTFCKRKKGWGRGPNNGRNIILNNLKNSQTKRKSQGVISIFPPIILPIHGMTHDKNDETNSQHSFALSKLFIWATALSEICKLTESSSGIP